MAQITPEGGGAEAGTFDEWAMEAFNIAYGAPPLLNDTLQRSMRDMLREPRRTWRCN